MKNLIKVAFIGSGNVAWHLAPAIDNATGFKVIEVYSPTEKMQKHWLTDYTKQRLKQI